nr:ATP-binding protein [uncultured Roseateles sp.]
MKKVPSQRHRRQAPSLAEGAVEDGEAALRQWARLIARGQQADAWARVPALRPAVDAPLQAQLRFRALELHLRLSASMKAARELLPQVQQLGREADALAGLEAPAGTDPAPRLRAEAECRLTESVGYRNTGLIPDALRCIARAEALYTELGDTGALLSTQTHRLRVYFAAGMYGQLVELGEALLLQETALHLEDLLNVLSNTASGYYYLLESGDSPGYRERCIALNQRALALAEAGGELYAQCLTRLNLATNVALLGQVEAARQHLATVGELIKRRGNIRLQSLREQYPIAQRYVQAICAFHEGRHDEAFAALEQTADRITDKMLMRLRNNIAATRVRLAEQAGRLDVALAASHRLHAFDQELAEEHIRQLVSDFSILSRQARIDAEHEALLSHGDGLERALAQRNQELTAALAHLQSEVELRRATEAALQSTHDELERKAQARAQSLHEARRMLARQEKLAALGNLGAGLAHELNTPIGNARLVASSLHDRAARLLQQIDSGSLRREHLLALVQESEGGVALLLQALQRLQQLADKLQGEADEAQRPSVQHFDASLWAARVLQEHQDLALQMEATLSLEAPATCACSGDAQAFAQVLATLLDNALRHGLHERPGGHVRLELLERAQQLELSVADDGCGLVAAHRERVFEPFFTTRFGQGGSGLGLHLAHQLARQRLGGELGLQAGEGGGARFVLRFPRHATAPDEALADGR